MATPAAYLSVVVEAQTAGATRSLKAVQTELQHTAKGSSAVEGSSKRMSSAVNESGKSASRAHLSFASLAKGVAAAGGAFAAYELAKGAITDTEALVTATIKLTAATGLDAKTASSWIEVMKARGVESTAVSLGFITLEKNIHNAEGGSKSATLAFKQLGVPMADIKKQNLQQTVLQIADAFQKSTNSTERTAIAQQLFGRNAKVLIPILAQGSQGIKQMLAAAQRYGAFLPNNIRQLKEAHDAQLNLNLAMDGLKIAFTRAVLPALVFAAKHLLAFITQMRHGKGAGGQFANAISSAFGTVKNVVSTVVHLFGGLGNTLKALAALWVAGKVFRFASAIGDVAKAVGGLGRLGVLSALTLGVGYLITKLLSLGGISRDVATSSHDVARAWRDAAAASKALNRQNLALSEAKVTEIRASQQQRQAQAAANKAFHEFGRNSPQWKAAALNLADASNALKDAQYGVRDSINAQDKASQKNLTVNQKAIRVESDHVATLGEQLNYLKYNHASLRQITAAQFAYDQGNRKLTGDLQTLLKAEGSRVNVLTAQYVWMKKTGATTDELKRKHEQLVVAVQYATSTQEAEATALKNSIPGDWERVRTLKAQVAYLQAIGASSDKVKAKQAQLRNATQGLNTDEHRLNGILGGQAAQMLVNHAKTRALKSAQDGLNTSLGLMPKDVSTSIGIGLKFTSTPPQIIGSIGSAIGSATSGLHFARGGMVNKPGYFAGEEAPQHPEVILATNPAHRQRNLRLWAQAGRMLGVPGFAQGGVTPADVVKQIVPGTVKMAESWAGRASKAYFSLPSVLHAAGFQAGGMYGGESGGWSTGGLGVSSTTNNITIHVNRDGDVGKVADVIDRATGSRLHAQLRAAGLRGT